MNLIKKFIYFGLIIGFLIESCNCAAAPKWENIEWMGRNPEDYHTPQFSTAENPNAKYNPNLPEEERSKYVGQKWTQQIKEEICTKAPDSGYYCMGAIGDLPPLHQRYYWDVRTASCRCMLYNGCDGNSNNFRSQDHCLQWCEPKLSLFDRITNTTKIYSFAKNIAKCIYFY